jgi:alpha-1,2-mannosyltransferase
VVLDRALGKISAYVYPPQLAVALVPLTPLSADAATMLALVASLAGLMGALAVLGVRDPRCYAAVLVWAPTIGALTVINLTPFLAFALALAWRLQATVWPLAVALGVAASAKLFLWPLLVWAVATRRFRAALLATVVGVGVTFGAWAVIGFQGLSGYPALLQKLGEKHAENSYSIVGMAAELGLSDAVGRLSMLGVGVALLAMGVVFARRGDDLRSFTSALAAALALSPIVWLHYLVLLLVPLAVARPRFSWVWLVPVLLWVSPQPGYTEGFATFLPAIAATALVGVLLIRPPAVRFRAQVTV